MKGRTYVCGHRNPDVDSVTSAYALSDLRRRTGTCDVEAVCAGLVPEKAQWVFDHFGLKPPRVKRDVYVRVRDLVDARLPLVDALKVLEASGESSLPVRATDGTCAGMLSPAKLLSLFISKADLTMPVAEAPLHFRPRSLGTVTIEYTLYEKYGLIYIIANGTETYASLARQFNLFRAELLRFNEEKKDHTIEAGTIVYLQAKRNQSTRDLARHVVQEGETMKQISQRFGVKLKNLYKFNGMKRGSEPETGSIINLCKVKNEKK